MNKFKALLIFPTLAFLLALSTDAYSQGEDFPGCSVQSLLRDSQEHFINLRDRRELFPGLVPEQAFRQAALRYLELAQTCYEELYGPMDTDRIIDDGGVIFEGPGDSANFVTNGRKWGSDTLFSGGQDIPGPGTPGGEVTYSFMPDGVDLSAEGSGSNVAIASLASFQACFQTEIANAFDAWAAVANISFSMVADDGLPLTSGIAGDIRIGAHVFDGPSNVLAHAYYPPPNGGGAAGDIHFDLAEDWACNDTGPNLDIGIVALHEIGHSLGLAHEVAPPTAIMNPTYNPVVAILQPDDIIGIDSIYGPSNVNCTIGVSESAYANNEIITISTLLINNPRQAPIPAELKIWVEASGGERLGLSNLGATGDWIVEAESSTEYGPAPLAGSDQAPAGVYLIGCRLLDPISGEQYSESIQSFEVLP